MTEIGWLGVGLAVAVVGLVAWLASRGRVRAARDRLHDERQRLHQEGERLRDRLLERRVLVAARRFKDLGAAASEDVPELPLMEVAPQTLAGGEEVPE